VEFENVLSLPKIYFLVEACVLICIPYALAARSAFSWVLYYGFTLIVA